MKNILGKLSPSGLSEALKAVANNPQNSFYLLLKMSNESEVHLTYIILDISRDRNTAPHILESLSSSSSVEVVKNVLNNHSCPPHILEELSKSDNIDLLNAIADNPYAPIHVLEELSKHNSESVLANVTRNSTTPLHILERLRSSDSVEVIKNILKNHSCPIYILEELSKSDNIDLLEEIADNPYTPIHVLEELSKHDCESVLARVAHNSNTPLYILEELIKQDYDYEDNDIYKCISHNRNSSASLLDNFADTQSAFIMMNLIYHPNTSADCLLTISYVWNSCSDTLFAISEHDNCSIELFENVSNSIIYRAQKAEFDSEGNSLEPHVNYQEYLVDLAKNEKSTIQILKKLSNFNNPYILRVLEENKNYPNVS